MKNIIIRLQERANLNNYKLAFGVKNIKNVKKLWRLY